MRAKMGSKDFRSNIGFKGAGRGMRRSRIIGVILGFALSGRPSIGEGYILSGTFWSSKIPPMSNVTNLKDWSQGGHYSSH